jgi:type I restriction/modification specificity protein
MSKILFENSNIEFIDGDRGKNYPKQEDFSDKGHCMFLSAKNVTSCGFNFDNKVFISSEKDNQLKAGKLKRNDIVITTRGTIGNVAIYDDKVPYNDVRINSGMLILRADSNKLDTKFLYYYLSSKEFKEQVNSLISGSAVPQLPIRDIKKLTLPNITKKQQEKIANIISSFEDRIELNTQINQTLEQIAQALFKSWFVDFDPVRAKVQALSDGLSLEQAELAAMQAISGKTAEELTALSQTQPDRYAELAETTKAFPCEMVEIDGVEVPKGWEVKPIELILDRLKNKQKLRKEEISFEGTIPVFEQGASILMGYHDKDAAFNASIDEPIFIFGDHTCITKLSTIPFSIYQNVIPLIGKNLPTYWVYCAIQNKQTFQEYRRHWAELIVKEVVVPDNINLCQYFSKKVKELFFKIDINHQENRTLIETRDLLLPRLLNGEI